MKGKIYAATIAAIIGMVLAVLIVNHLKDDTGENKTGEFTKLDATVEYTMTHLFKSPPAITNHGWNVDRMIVFVHLLMAVLFVGWTAYYIYCLFAFNSESNPKADYHGVRSKLGTTLAEYGVIVAEVILIVCFAVPLWAEVMDESQIKEIKAKSLTGEGLELHILSKQFDWNARYAGNDGRFSPQSLQFANKVDNPFGLDPEDTTIDDVVITTARSKDNSIVVPWGKPVALKLTSMDVIHSFKVLPLRVCKDCIPGLQLPIHFQINANHLEEGRRGVDDEHVFLITCAQLCGDGHGYMNGYIKAVHPDKFKDWLKTKSDAELKKRIDQKASLAKR